jgi:hypothetical protein
MSKPAKPKVEVRARRGGGVVTLPMTLLRKLAEREPRVGKLLSGYAEATSQAERLGEPVEMIVTVDPAKAEPTIVAKPARGDALDRALTKARSRGAGLVSNIMKSPDMVTGREFANLIGASHETVNQKRKSNEVLALEGATRGLRYPKWQVTDDGRLLPGLPKLFRELGGNSWTVYRFLLQRHGELGGKTGLEALKRNHLDKVLATARNISEGVFA